MLITPANLDFFFTALETRFWQAYANAPQWYTKVSTVYPCSTEAWISGWMGMLDKLRVWKGSRLVRNPAPQTYGVTMLPFELTEEIDKFKLADDQHGIYTPLVAMMGENAAKWPDYTLRDLLQGNGEFAGTQPQLGTDGVTHWNAAHPVDVWDASKGTYPNDYGTVGVVVDGVTVGGTFSTNAFATIWQDHASRKHEGGEAIGTIPDLTMVPAQLHFPAKTLLQSMFFSPPQLGTLGSGAGANAPFVGNLDNPLRGSTDVLMNPDIAEEPTAFYLLDTRRAIKPFGWVLRQAPSITPRTSPQDPAVFDRHAFIFGVEARGAPAWSLPWLSSRSGIV